MRRASSRDSSLGWAEPDLEPLAPSFITLRILVELFRKRGVRRTDPFQIALRAAEDSHGTEADARDALKSLVDSGCVEATPALDHGVLTDKGEQLARKLRTP